MLNLTVEQFAAICGNGIKRLRTTLLNAPVINPSLGVRSWIVERDTRIASTREWVPANTDPPSPATEKPSGASPVQHVSPATASMVASLAGCRLPSADELRSAASDTSALELANLRDAAWLNWARATVEASNRLGNPLNPPLAHAGVFPVRTPIPGDESPQSSDTVIWFRPCPAETGGWSDLIGNVARELREPLDMLVVNCSWSRYGRPPGLYTDEELAARFAPGGRVDFEALSRLPTLFVQESQAASNAAARRKWA